MSEVSVPDSQLEKFIIGIGRCANGRLWPLDLAKSHGIIIGGRESHVAAGQILKAVHEHAPGRYSVTWVGDHAPEWLASWSGSRTVSAEGVMALLESFSAEQIHRFDVMKEAGSNNLPHFNAIASSKDRQKWPVVFLVIEDFLAVREASGPLLLDKLCFIARYGRACGMLPVICTEDASPERLPSLLKAEIADRICTGVASRRDSLSLLQALGGESLQSGELLYRRMVADTDVIRLNTLG